MNRNRSLAEKIEAYSDMQPREDFIIQNVTLGPHYVSDIKLAIEPFGIVDLTWENPLYVKSSNNLKYSLKSGILRRITREEFERIEDARIQKEKDSLGRAQASRKMNVVTDADGKQIVAETFDAQNSYNKKSEVSTSGYANDSLTYVTALNAAQVEAAAQGRELTVEAFAELVENDPSLIGRYVNSSNSSTGFSTKLHSTNNISIKSRSSLQL